MVVPGYFKEILQCFEHCPAGKLSLPPLKEQSLKLEYEKCNVQDVAYSQEPILPFSVSKVYEANVSHWRRLAAEDPNSHPIYEISLDIQDIDVVYKPGDTIGIIPKNLKEEVDRVINHLDIGNVADCNYNLSNKSDRKGAKLPPHIPIKATLRHTLTHCVDLRGVAKKVFLVALSVYTSDDSEKKVLEYLSSKEGFLAYTAHVLNKSMCLLDIFNVFKTCKPPVEIILEHLPRLFPRPYSICNSYHTDSKKLKICFSVKDIGNDRRGLTTGYIEKLILRNNDVNKKLEELNLNETTIIPFYFRKNVNEFCMPENLDVPLILIGPGTGVSPFIGFLEEREYHISKKNGNVGYTWLFNGCRHPRLDFIYEKELRQFVSKGVLNKMSTAFSRDDTAECRYVQDCIKRHSKEVAKLIEDGAYILVCGDVNKMAKDVKAAIVKCVENTGKLYEDAVEYVAYLEREKRYIVDVWN